MKSTNSLNTGYIGKPPSWMVKHGTVLLGVFLFLVLLLGSFIQYDEVVTSEITITTDIPPSYISPKRNGVISEIKIKSGDYVLEGEILAILKNTSDTEHAIEVRNKIDGEYDTISSIESLKKIFPLNKKLGENQIPYNNFISAYQGYINFNFHQRDKLKGRGLKEQTEDQRFALSRQREKLRLSQRRLKLLKEDYKKQEGLFTKGVISQSELQAFESTLIEGQQNMQNEIQLLSLLKVETSKMESANIDSDLSLLELENNYASELWGTRQSLMSALDAWKENNLLIAPTEGNISTFDIWENFQNVNKDDYVFSITPKNGGKILGKLKVPLSNSGNIKKAQKVVIKLENYPFREWGSLMGKIVHISDVPKKAEKSYYSVYVELDDLTTSFGKKIIFKQEMVGKGHIVIKETSLLSRIFYQFMGIWE